MWISPPSARSLGKDPEKVSDARVVEVMHEAVHQDEVELGGTRDVRCHIRDSKLSAVALSGVRDVTLVEVNTEILGYSIERASVGARSTTDIENGASPAKRIRARYWCHLLGNEWSLPKQVHRRNVEYVLDAHI